MKDDFAVVVGVATYPQMTSLKGAVKDANAFEQWLLDSTGGDVPQANIKVITSPDATSEIPIADQIDDVFLKLVRRARLTGRLGRRLYIFFSGHGIAPGGDLDEAALLMANAARDCLARHIPGRAYAMAFEAEAFFDEIVLIMDCCRDDFGKIEKRHIPWTQGSSKRSRDVRRYHAFATRWYLKAYEQPITNGRVDPYGGEYRGVFAYAFLEALREATPDAEGRVTGAQVASYVKNRLPQLLPTGVDARAKFDFETDRDVVFSIAPSGPAGPDDSSPGPQAPSPPSSGPTAGVAQVGTVTIRLVVPDGTHSVEITNPDATIEIVPATAPGIEIIRPLGMYGFRNLAGGSPVFENILGRATINVDLSGA